ncbi:TMEM165/GDT1 family protein [Spirulina sp. CS-785/01]|uniref:TMEM165/GDT1 family protein n=1 Tax=Spirulina sp. CS-785/01 TaxID=3021716 RepID=UPI003FA6F869
MEPVSKQFYRSFRATFTATFATIFLAEMGDKTQLATLLMSAESGQPWIVFCGAALALIATSLIGVLLGWWLAKRVSPKAMDMAAATILLIVSILLLGDVVQM